MAQIDFEKAMKTLQKTISPLTGVIFSTTVSAVIVGVLLYKVVTAGNITVYSEISTFLVNWSSDVVGFFTTYGTAITVTLGLLVVAVIVVLFGSFIGKSGKGDKM